VAVATPSSWSRMPTSTRRSSGPVWGKMNNTGQCCVAAKRFIVVEELADRFLDKLQTALAALEPGDPMDKATTLGPLSMEAAQV